jgi:hypothetical protein
MYEPGKMMSEGCLRVLETWRTLLRAPGRKIRVTEDVAQELLLGDVWSYKGGTFGRVIATPIGAGVWEVELERMGDPRIMIVVIEYRVEKKSVCVRGCWPRESFKSGIATPLEAGNPQNNVQVFEGVDMRECVGFVGLEIMEA